MNKLVKTIAVGATLGSLAPSIALAEGFYFSTQLGYSIQATDSEPYGNNIAVDPNFPGKFDSGDSATAGIGLGYAFTDQFRLEARIGTRDSNFDDTKFGTNNDPAGEDRAGEEYVLNGEIESTTYTIEGFYDFANRSKFTPYIKAGIGIADNSYSARLGGAGVAAFDAFDGEVDGYYDAYSDGSSSEFAWNAGVGGHYELTEAVSIYGEYQYGSFGDVKTGQDLFTDGFTIEGITANELVVGFRVSF